MSNKLPVLRPNPNPHYHQCGRVRDGWLDGYGCGFMWQHRRDPTKSLVEDHMCPNCDRGPWYYELSIEEVESGQASKAAV